MAWPPLKGANRRRGGFERCEDGERASEETTRLEASFAEGCSKPTGTGRPGEDGVAFQVSLKRSGSSRSFALASPCVVQRRSVNDLRSSRASDGEEEDIDEDIEEVDGEEEEKEARREDGEAARREK